ncbi:MAG: glycosyltransferase family 39 protein [Deltaproteobacteria bacterium]|nr:glycosyltransferase family 39 protein [Deltaproteobacteria bacterium]
MSLSSQFYSALIGSTVIKIGLAVFIPLTSDEAYFFVLGKYLDYGYYEHPPMAGWLIHFLLYGGDSRLILRLPNIFFGIIIGLALYQFLKRTDKKKAQILAVLFWISPFNLLNVIITNDAPLTLFTFLSGLLFFKGFEVEKKVKNYFLLSGIFLGLAFFSKYFAVLLAGAFLGYVLIFQRNRRGINAILWTFWPAAFFVLLNLYWNYTHCWDNIVFNFFVRHQDPIQFSLINFIFFLAGQIYLITPVVFYYLLKDRKSIRENLETGHFFIIPLVLYGVPLLILAFLSFFILIGLHWTLSFIPFAFIIFFIVFSPQTLRRMVKPMVLFSAGHLLLILAALLLFQAGKFEKLDLYKNTIISIKAREICSLLKPVRDGFLLTSESYDDVSMLQYYCGQFVTQFGKGSKHGRQFDKLTDFSRYQDKNILIVRGGSPNEDFFRKFFEKIEIKENRIGDHPVFFIFGYKFKYTVYKEKILREILVSFYQIPSWLPCGDCYFKDHYFGRN